LDGAHSCEMRNGWRPNRRKKEKLFFQFFFSFFQFFLFRHCFLRSLLFSFSTQKRKLDDDEDINSLKKQRSNLLLSLDASSIELEHLKVKTKEEILSLKTSLADMKAGLLSPQTFLSTLVSIYKERDFSIGDVNFMLSSIAKDVQRTCPGVVNQWHLAFASEHFGPVIVSESSVKGIFEGQELRSPTCIGSLNGKTCDQCQQLGTWIAKVKSREKTTGTKMGALSEHQNAIFLALKRENDDLRKQVEKDVLQKVCLFVCSFLSLLHSPRFF